MIFPDERVPEVCRLGSIRALELLDRARGGDLQALADWTVRAAYRRLRNLGATDPQALRHTRNLIAGIELKPCLIP